MSAAVMFLIVLACVVAASCLLRNVIRKVPWVFYILAVVVAGLYLLSAYEVVDLPREVDMSLMYLVRRGFLATAMFILVMYIGVFPRGTAARRFLQPLRAPLSIVGCILILAHIVYYLTKFSPTKVNTIIAFWLGVLLFVLALILGVTSFRFVKKHMSGTAWKRVQWFAYVFYVAMFVHMSVMLLPSVIRGGSAQAVMTTSLYVILFVAYFAARIYRVYHERKKGLAEVDLSKSQAEVEDQQAEL